MRKLLLLLVSVLLLAPMATNALTINEIRIDNDGVDTDEYFELAGNPGESLDGYSYIVIGDGVGGSGVLESITDLTGQLIQADGFLAVHKELTVGVCTGYDVELPMNFENSDNVTHMLVLNLTGFSQDDLDTDDDGVFDVTPWDSIVDSVSMIESIGSGELVYGMNSVGPDGTFVPGQALVCDGDWVIGSFDLCLYDTPGAYNTACTVSNDEATFSEIKAMYR